MKITLQIEDPHAHLIKIRKEFKSISNNPILEMPSWSPGSYLIRDYSRHVQNFTASKNGERIKSVKILKNQWQIESTKDDLIEVTYLVYAFDLTVRTSYLDNRKGFFSPGSLFMYQIDSETESTSKLNKIILEIDLDHDWHVFTSLNREMENYIAEDFDELVDSPIGIAKSELLMQVDYSINDGYKDIPNTVAVIGDHGNTDMDKFVENLKKLQINSIEMFGDLPYDRYLWLLYVVGKGGGGLEHKYSNCSIIPRWMFKEEKDFNRLMSLEAHEHFHVYNVKRIRVKQLGPFDYSEEVYTTTLWVAEGITSFYDNILLPRSGITSDAMYWEVFAKDLSTLLKNPGRFVMSIEESSFNAWIKLYKPDENSVNSMVSYYLKGGIVAFILDLEIRKQTNWAKSLDDFYRFMYAKYKENKDEGYDEAILQQLIEEATNSSLREFWKKYISGVDEIAIEEYLDLIGCKLVREAEIEHLWVGMDLNSKQKVTKVMSNSPAMKAGIYANDEIVTINGYKANKDGIKNVLSNTEEEKTIEIGLFRDNKFILTTVTPVQAPLTKISIERLEDANELQNKRYKEFLNLKD